MQTVEGPLSGPTAQQADLATSGTKGFPQYPQR